MAMRLKDYLELDGQSAAKLAKDIGCSTSTITRAANGQCLPNFKVRHAIAKATRGVVTSADLIAACDEFEEAA